MDRADVRDPGRTAPVWIYRIAQRGADRLAEEEGTPRVLVGEPRPRMRPERPVFLARSCVDVLAVLRQVREERAGDPGWMRTPEIRTRVWKLGPGRGFYPHDLARLERAGLIERQSARVPGIRNPAVWCRVTDQGLRILPLDWRDG